MFTLIDTQYVSLFLVSVVLGIEGEQLPGDSLVSWRRAQGRQGEGHQRAGIPS